MSDDAPLIQDETDRLGLYVHWPYCARICPYCDFNVYKAANGDPDGLLAAMLEDLALWRERTGPRKLASVHFGGGTPSLMTPAAISAVLERAEALFGFEPGAEIGLEANPAERRRLADIAKAGVERLSLGVQALDDASLKALGRDHDAAAGLDAIEIAQTHFDRVSFDLIYAREGQSLDAWARELTQAIGFGAGHLSLYQLTIEPGTAFQKKRDRGELTPPDDDHAAAMFEMTQEITEAAGLPAYEVSNHARTPRDQSAHNRLYWQGADWIGIGPGAHSRIGRADREGRISASALRRPVDYMSGVSGGQAHQIEPLSARDEAVERVLMGLRLIEDGLNTAKTQKITGTDMDPNRITALVSEGVISAEDGVIRLTRKGRVFADYAAQQLAPV